MSKKSTAEKASSIVVFLLVFGAIATIFSPGVESSLREFAREVNKTLPRSVDAVTSLATVSIRKPKKIVFHYDVSLKAEDCDSEKLNRELKPQLIQQLKDNPKARELAKKDIWFLHEYKAKNGPIITTISIAPDEYK
jgi:hypothetical protein